ncbi:MAG: ATP-binding domain-containing protein [Myxococcales bacterium]|nr:ATP-binding domain-containing protein [Myxococcales bacterium]
MPTPVASDSQAAAIIAEEIALWSRVSEFLARSAARAGSEAASDASLHDQELIELRDAIAEAKPEDVAPLVEQMARVTALAAGRRGKLLSPVDLQTPYFAHLRLRSTLGRVGRGNTGRSRDVLIGRRGFIDRAADIQIVDWRDAPVSQLYYRYDEGDDYDEEVNGQPLQGILEVRRNVTIRDGRVCRIGCPQGTFFCDAQDVWWQTDGEIIPTLEGGQGLAARAPRPTSPPPKSSTASPPRPAPAPQLAGQVDKHLPEIAALIDRHQFDLISQPESGVVVIQGGAGSGKTTVALHRVAFLAHSAPDRFRGNKMLVIVPTPALVRYVSGVLPALGVPGVPVVTCAEWMRNQLRRLLPHLPQRIHGESPTVVARLKKHPAMLGILREYVAAQAVELRAQLDAALSPELPERTRILQIWDQLKDRPLRSRCRVVRQNLPSSMAPGVAAHLDLLLRRMTRRARDVTRDWSEVLTDFERLWRGFSAWPASDADESRLPPVTRSDVQQLVEHCRAQQEDVPEEAQQSPQSTEHEGKERPTGTRPHGDEEDDDGDDDDRFRPVDGRPLDEDSVAGILDPEDPALLLRLLQLKWGGLAHGSGKGFVRYEHLVLDEVQDLSACEVKVLIDCVTSDEPAAGSERGSQRSRDSESRRAHAKSITMAGDVVQRLIFDNGFTSWDDLLTIVGLPEVRVQRLRILYRSTIEVMALARAVLGPLATAANVDQEQQAVRHGAPVKAFSFGEVGEAVAFLGESLRSLLGREPTASVALLARHAGMADLYYRGLGRSDVPSLRRVDNQEFTFTPGIDMTDVTQVKGLEFDYVILLDATANAYPDTTEARHLLHIAMTRAAHQLWLISAGAPSPLIPAHYFTDSPPR